MPAAESAESVDEVLRHLSARPAGDGWALAPPGWFGDYLFGGFVIAQAIAATTKWAPADRRLHSLHAYFLRPVRGGADLIFTGGLLREGRAFAAAQVHGVQDGKEVVVALASFTADTDGFVYDLGASEPLPPLDEAAAEPGPPPWFSTGIGPTKPLSDGTRTSTHRMWFRVPGPLPADEHLHTALLGFASDWTGTGGRPLRLDGDTQGMVSLDHSVWFHRAARADEWHFYDVQSLVNAGGRGLVRGVMRDRTGRVIASMTQEMRITP